MKAKILTLIVLSVIITLNCKSQKAPIKFGTIDIEDLKMSDYNGDTSVPAMVLCDYGYFSSATFQFTRTLRIKIFNQEGTSWASSTYPTSSKSMIKGITYNLVDGKIVQDKLKNESIYVERVSGQSYRTRIAMPNVKAGSVIDIQFVYEGIPLVWKFQQTIPVKHSELLLEDHPYVRFSKNFFGFVKLNISTPNRWAAFNVPAFKEEPFINSNENYLTKLEFDILDIGYGTSYTSISTSWDAINKLLSKSENFGMTLQGTLYLGELARSISSTGKPKTEQLKMAYDAIRTSVKWDENSSLETSSPNLGYVLKMKVGNSADINLMLTQLLKKLDIDAVPVLMSTRDNGVLSPITPSYQKLNYVISLARIDTAKYLLDATDEYLPYYLLPVRTLNYKGRTYKETGSEWVDIAAKKISRKIILYDITLNDDLTMNGSMSRSSADYAAYNIRKSYHAFNSQDEYVEDFASDNPGLRINSSSIEMIDSIYNPVLEKYEVTITDKAISAGNEIFLQPLLFDQMNENPFTAESRTYPIDFAYNSDKSVICTFKIPTGFTVSSLPATAIFKLPKNGGVFRYEAVKTDQEIKVISRLTITKSFFMPDEYAALREFYNQVIKKQSETIILKTN